MLVLAQVLANQRLGRRTNLLLSTNQKRVLRARATLPHFSHIIKLKTNSLVLFKLCIQFYLIQDNNLINIMQELTRLEYGRCYRQFIRS